MSNKAILTSAEVAPRLGLSQRRVAHLLKRGDLVGKKTLIRVGPPLRSRECVAWAVPAAEVDRYLREGSCRAPRTVDATTMPLAAVAAALGFSLRGTGTEWLRQQGIVPHMVTRPHGGRQWVVERAAVERAIDAEKERGTLVRAALPPRARRVVAAVCDYLEVDFALVLAHGRSPRYTEALRLIVTLLYEDMGYSVSALGRMLGGRDHATIIHHLNSRPRWDSATVEAMASCRRALARKSA